MGSVISTSRSGRVLVIEINRPEQLNALNSEVLLSVREVIQSVQREPDTGCVVLRGTGGRAFSAGADLAEIRGLGVVEAQSFIENGHRTMSAVSDSRVPVIAEVDGYALGGGFELALACHIVIASQRSQFGLPEARIGCMPGFGGTQRLPRTVGKAAAMHLMLTGERIDAARAWQIGLLSVPPLPGPDLTAEVARQAALIASGSASGMANILNAARIAVAPFALSHEAALAAICIASPDGQEGITSFAERRSPRFHKESS